MTNPFAPNVPAQAEAPQQQAPAGNPFAQQAPQQQYAPAAPQQQNPYAGAQQQVQQGIHPVQQAAAPAYAPPAPPQQVQQPQQGGNPFQGAGYAPPPGVSHMQHVAATYQQQAAPAQQRQAAPPPLGQLNAAPAPVVGGGQGPNLVAMYGRLVIAFPLAIETVPRNPKYITDQQRAQGNVTQERMTVTFVVLDDGHGGNSAIAYGGAPHEMPPRPHTQSAPLPALSQALWISQSRMVQQLRPFLPAGSGAAPGMAVGRIVKSGPAHNDPWYLESANDRDMVIAQYYIDAVARGEFPHPLA